LYVFFETEATVTAAGAVIVVDVEAEQLLTSLTATAYVPAAKPEKTGDVWNVPLLIAYCNCPVPPEAFTVI
jgi:hypothetical protein